MTRVAAALAALAALGITHLLPETGLGLYLRLAAAVVVVLVPGRLIAAALGQRSVSATVAWSLAAIFAALAATFALAASLTTTIVLLAAIAVAAAALAVRRDLPPRPVGTSIVFVVGALFGIALWQIAGELQGDALFHLARVRKLDELDSLSLRAVSEFADGGLHPGYAFPLWHGFVALVARLGGVDPAAALVHAPSVLVPLAFLAVYEAGARLFRSAAAGAAVLLAQVALAGLAAGHGGRYASLALPGTAARDLLVPAGLALFFAYVADPRRSIPSHTVLVTIAAAALALALVHPTYALFVAVPLVGFWIVRGVVARAEIRPIGVALGGLLLPAAAVFLWLLPIVRDTASHRPEDDELRRALAQYAGQVDVLSERSYRLAPEVFGRSGAVAIAALCLIPLAALALRRRWAAFVLGGSLAVLAIMLTPLLFSSFADAVSLSQARRAAGFLPFAFAFAGGVAVLTRLLGSFLLPVALAAGIALQLAYPGDFAYRLEDGGPAVVTWFAALGGAGALIAVAVVRRRPGALDRRNALVPLAAALFVLPVAVHGLANWDVRPARSAAALTAGLERAVRTDVPEGDVVFSDLETSYRLAAAAPVYIAAAPPGHVADTVENRPYERREDVRVFLRTGDLAIPRRYRARWIVVDRNLFRKPLSLPSAYADARYVLYRLR